MLYFIKFNTGSAQGSLPSTNEAPGHGAFVAFFVCFINDQVKTKGWIEQSNGRVAREDEDLNSVELTKFKQRMTWQDFKLSLEVVKLNTSKKGITVRVSPTQGEYQ